ncbi:MAG: GntR family transcriptional regulator [Clostridiales bacterium]|mgnify:CR=1 FL=1|nr:GntR family transcriptional regulator [Clostridiales bacterium]MDO4349643.1 GntR family transcriptional regulator [Eubacteriales bacterium]MDY4009825.1 GntR family transcriptional regulator [Candidatus Limiplasma sp.]
MAQLLTTDHEQMYQELAGEILRFAFKPGDLLSENYLCQRFHVSRTPVRSVLQRLQENGLVQIIPRKGSIVTRLDFDIINQCIYERLAVETMVMRDFIRTCTALDVEKTRQVFSQLQALGELYHNAPRQFDAARFLRTDMAMHETWFGYMKKRYLWERLSSPRSSYTRFCTLDILEGNNVDDVLAEHAEMLNLIDSGNTKELEPLLRRHFYGGVRRLGKLIFTKYIDYFEPMGDEPADEIP